LSIEIKKIVNGKWKENCYLVIHSFSQHAIIIDPGNVVEEITEYVTFRHLKILAILNTHAHYDHIGSVAELKNTFSIPFYLHSKDIKLLNHANLYRQIFDGEGYVTIPKVDYFFDQITLPLTLNEFLINVVVTPGHTEGGVCILIDDYLFTGDTLLYGKIGRTDLPGGNQDALYDSLRRLAQLPQNLVIYPGHGQSSFLGEELKHNHELSEQVQ